MCGRFSQAFYSQADDVTRRASFAEAFQVNTTHFPPPRYNVAPSQLVAAIFQIRNSTHRQLHLFRWGLVPAWVKDPTKHNKPINARSETVTEKPSFRAAFRYRRCLIPADGFYEWQKVNSRQKQPYFLSLQDSTPLAFAGLYEEWESPAGEFIESCTILTTTANELVSPIHDRMPVILDPQDYAMWLDPSFDKSDKLQALLKPYPAAAMQAYPVSTLVNSPETDTVECQQRLSEVP
jgi:putative SOS response-associated peptidase YedK